MGVSTQMNLRLGFTPSVLHPKINDSLVPVYWAAESVVPPERTLKLLMGMQGAPKKFEGLLIICVLIGASLISFACCNVLRLAVHERHARGSEVRKVVPVDN